MADQKTHGVGQGTIDRDLHKGVFRERLRSLVIVVKILKQEGSVTRLNGVVNNAMRALVKIIHTRHTAVGGSPPLTVARSLCATFLLAIRVNTS
jgi:hypothetical protein